MYLNKTLAACLLLFSLFTLAGCPSSNSESPQDNSPPEKSKKTKGEVAGQLAKYLKERGQNETDPTVLIHLFSALGPDWKSNLPQKLGRKYLQPREVKGQTYYAFPAKEKGRVVEPHTNQFLKVFREVNYTGKVTGEVKVKDLAQSARALFRNRPEELKNDLGWSLLVFAEKGPHQWTNAWSEKIELASLAQVAMTWLEDLMGPIERARKKEGDLKKGEIHSWYCGGFHLFQAVLACQKAGLYPQGKEKIQNQIALHLYRIRKEPGMYWARIKKQYQKRSKKYFKLSLYVNFLKFYGHALEILAYARNQGLWTPSKEEKKIVLGGWENLKKIVVWLFKKKVYENLDRLREKLGDRFYRDLLNDSCHALKGLRAWEG